MKNLLLLLLLALPLLSTGQRFNAGVMAGGVLSQIDGDTWHGYNKFGLLGGIYTTLNLSPHSSLQLEIDYIQKGARKNADLEAGDVNSWLLRLHYVEVPLLYQFRFMQRAGVEIGPAMDVLVGSYEEANGIEVPYNTVPLRNVTLSGILGVTAYLTPNLKAAFRWNYSMLSIRVPQSDGYPQGYRKFLFETGQFNNVISLSLAWEFRSSQF